MAYKNPTADYTIILTPGIRAPICPVSAGSLAEQSHHRAMVLRNVPASRVHAIVVARVGRLPAWSLHVRGLL